MRYFKVGSEEVMEKRKKERKKTDKKGIRKGKIETDFFSDKLTYRDSGVDISKADKIKSRIKEFAKRTLLKNVLFDIGPFSAGIDFYGKVLLATCDGVGTKTKLAIEFGKPEGLGYDLVAMNVNDILAMHGKPIFFLDYIGMNNLDEKLILKIIESISNACVHAQCSLVGGETAEMPGFYSENSFELVGFCIGEARKENLSNPESVEEGDVILAFPSSGPHSNGYSLIRKLISQSKIKPGEKFNGKKVIDILLEPTKIYVRDFFLISENFSFPKVSAHITGGGIPGNLIRVLPEGKTAVIRKKILEEISEKFSYGIFSLLSKHVEEEEIFRVFNMGVGFLMIFPQETAQKILKSSNIPVFEVGYVEKGQKKVVLSS